MRSVISLLVAFPTASASSLQLTEPGSVIFGTDRASAATLTATCGAAKPTVTMLRPSTFQGYDAGATVTAHVGNVAPTCLTVSDLRTPCAVLSSEHVEPPPLFYCIFSGDAATASTGPVVANATSVDHAGQHLGYSVTVACPFPSYDDFISLGPYDGSLANRRYSVNVSVAHFASVGPGALLFEYKGAPGGSAIAVEAMPGPPAPPFLPSPTPPPSQPPPPPACYGFLTPLGDMTYPAGTTTLNTNDSPYGFNFTTLTIPAGATVTAIGESPLRIHVSGAADVAGILSVNGGNGDNGIDYQIGGGGGAGGGALLLVASSLTVSGTISANGGNGGSVQTTNGVLNPNNGGVGVAGGSNGGNGGLQNVGGYAGYGAGGGHGGRQESGWPGGGTGGGYGQNGAPCSGGACDHPTVGGLAYGDETMSTGLLGGSGGGGGGNDGDNEEGPGGGGSGGGIWIRAGSLVLSGTVSALGGSIGYNNGSPQAGAGGVGRIRLDYNSKSGSVPTTQYYDGQTTSCAASIF